MYEAKQGGRNRVVEAKSLGREYVAVSFRWNHNWECGEETIDGQHKELFHMVGQLADASSCILQI